MTQNNYDTIAPIYDRLATLVFGSSIYKAKLNFLHCLPQGGNILIIGGGSGQTIQPILRHTNNTTIYFIEKSRVMIENARKNIPTNLTERVKFINGTEKSIPDQAFFNAIITNFFLDQFTPHQLDGLISELHKKLLPRGQWLYVDFVLSKNNVHYWWQAQLVWLMHLFFKIVTDLENDKLVDISPYLIRQQLVLRKEKQFYSGLISARVYEKIE